MTPFGIAFDTETDGLQATRLHCAVLEDGTEITDENDLADYFSVKGEFACHNLCRYDVPTLE